MAATIALWRIAKETPDFPATDMSGGGAAAAGGRWNRPGTPALYAATTVSLAILETLAHLGTTTAVPQNRYLVRIDVPAAAWRKRSNAIASAPPGWDALPPGRASLDYGDAWLKSASSLVLEVPSVIVPEESSVLLNPAHPMIARCAAMVVRKLLYDPRLLGLMP